MARSGREPDGNRVREVKAGLIEVRGHIDRLPNFMGDHLWLIIATYDVGSNPHPDDGLPLTYETIVQTVGPACWWCDEPWAATLVRRDCPGGGMNHV